MSWIFQRRTFLPPGTRVRTLGEPDKATLVSARNKRWELSKGPAYRAKWRANPEKRDSANERNRRWRASESGQAWLERSRERRNYYYRMRYHSDAKRRAYLAEKQRQYRDARKQTEKAR